MGKQWDKIFKERGKYFTKPQKDIPRIVKLFKKKGIKKVFDLGCGSGRHIIYLAKQGFKVYGFDISEHGIKISRNWLKKEGLKANLKIGSIYKKLPYKDNFFNAVVSIRVIHHAKIKKVQKLIREIERILKPGGLLFITVAKSPPKKIIMPMVESKMIAPRTYVSLEGKEKGAIHYLYNKTLLKKDFRNFKIYNIWADSSTKKHYCLLGELKSK
ncbi:MAG: class I SAM-dependent methyltransferase [Candidatus Paceibacterota bacterium]